MAKIWVTLILHTDAWFRLESFPICFIRFHQLFSLQIALSDEQNQCIYDENGNVKRYDEVTARPQTEIFVPEEIRNSANRRPSRKDIVQFLLDLLEEEE